MGIESWELMGVHKPEIEFYGGFRGDMMGMFFQLAGGLEHFFHILEIIIPTD
jgi:hypothetical protein